MPWFVSFCTKRFDAVSHDDVYDDTITSNVILSVPQSAEKCLPIPCVVPLFLADFIYDTRY